MSIDTLLTAALAATLRAAVDRIIPADDYPSGWEAGVGDYFARLFAREAQFLPAYQDGLDALDQAARAATGVPFAALGPDQQDALLAHIEAEERSAAFFRLLVDQTMEGFYANPGNGGNKDGIAWEMIGYRVTA